MKITGVFAVILLLCMYGDCHAQSTVLQDRETLVRYITDHQFKNEDVASLGSLGAIWAYADTTTGDTVYKVVPYMAHYAARGLLRTGNPENYKAVRKWMNWYVWHLDTLGRMVNHYYRDGGTTDTILGPYDIDAQDADPALFWILASEYYTAVNNKGFFTRFVKAKLEAAEKFIADSLTDADNLTFANINFAMKYTMNNAELYQGLMALATIEKEVYKDMVMYNECRARAAKMQIGIMQRMFDPVSGLYRYSANGKTDVSKWNDEGVVALIWPQLCGLDAFSSAHAARQREALSQNFNDKNGKDWTTVDFVKNNIDTYPWASVGYAFTMGGDTARGHAQLNYILGLFNDPEQSGHCNIAEAGWTLMHLAAVAKK